MNIPAIVDEEVMEHIALYGCVRNMDPYAQHILKTSEDPLLRFRRAWMRRIALQQHLDAEKRQKRINERFKDIPVAKGATVRRAAVVDQHLKDEMQHYNKAARWNDKGFLGDVRREAPAFFPRRESV